MTAAGAGVREKLLPCSSSQEAGPGHCRETTACVRDTGTPQTRCAFLPTAGVGLAAGARVRKACARPRFTGARRGPQHRKSRVRARSGEDTNTVRDLPTAGVPTAGAGGKSSCPAPVPQEAGPGHSKETAACVRGRAKTQTRCAICPPQARVRARHGEETNTVRVLPTAGVLAAGARVRG